MPFSDRQAQIVGLFVETLLYGIFIVVFGISMRCFFWDSKGHGRPFREVKKGLLIIALALFSTLDLTLGVVNDYDGLLSPGGQAIMNTPRWLTNSRVCLFFLTSIPTYPYNTIGRPF